VNGSRCLWPKFSKCQKFPSEWSGAYEENSLSVRNYQVNDSRCLGRKFSKC
jgi:hypothetical protein